MWWGGAEMCIWTMGWILLAMPRIMGYTWTKATWNRVAMRNGLVFSSSCTTAHRKVICLLVPIWSVLVGRALIRNSNQTFEVQMYRLIDLALDLILQLCFHTLHRLLDCVLLYWSWPKLSYEVEAELFAGTGVLAPTTSLVCKKKRSPTEAKGVFHMMLRV